LAAGFLLSGCHKPVEAVSTINQLERAFPDPKLSADVTAAITAAKHQDYVTGVVALERAKSVPGLSAQQLMAVEQANQSLTQELVRRADAGDAQAKSELQRIERIRSQ
jgi:hypothetical protein